MRINFILFVTLVMAMSSAQARLLDFSKMEYGLGVSGASSSFSHDEGDTQRGFVLPLELSVNYSTSRSSRVTFSAIYFSTEYDAEGSSLAESVTFFDFSGVYTRRFPVSRTSAFWLGGGFATGYGSFDNRYTVTHDGFLDEEFSNESGLTDLGYLGLVSYSFSVGQGSRASDFSVDARYRESMSGDFSPSIFSIGIKYYFGKGQ